MLALLHRNDLYMPVPYASLGHDVPGKFRDLAADPELIILDEALSNFDRVLQLQMLELLAELRARLGTAFLLITHDLSLVRHCCQRVILLADGHIAEDREVTPRMRLAHPAGQRLEAAVLPCEPMRARVSTSGVARSV
jgi:nickel transport system ATP-binding protein